MHKLSQYALNMSYAHRDFHGRQLVFLYKDIVLSSSSSGFTGGCLRVLLIGGHQT